MILRGAVNKLNIIGPLGHPPAHGQGYKGTGHTENAAENGNPPGALYPYAQHGQNDIQYKTHREYYKHIGEQKQADSFEHGYSPYHIDSMEQLQNAVRRPPSEVFCPITCSR